ncbi:unnamed protein product, partial [Adineta steineri]
NGYWNDQEKTESSFIIHPLTKERFYRTGDYGRFLPNGYIEFMGRKDFQVKVHGHRIELGEIEHHLQQHPDIHQAIVNIDDKSQHLFGYVMPEKYSIHDKEYDSTEMLITDPIERMNFKLARHSIRHQKKMEKSFALTKPKLTETLINTYYKRKSYRQFTNEIIERSTIEKLLKNCRNHNNNEQISLSHLDSDSLSQLLAVLTPISISDQPLPKYRYASIDDLYPVQVYVELPTSIDNNLPGVYYHNPDEHTLKSISTHINNDMTNIRLHLVGRSSTIAPLYGKRLGSQFCMLETGYIMGLLEKEGSRLGLIFSKNTHNESIIGDILNIDDNDTHCSFEILSLEQNISNNVQKDNYQCIIYLKSVNNNKDQWFTYDKEYDTVIPFDVKTETTQEEIPLFFDDDNDAKIIFHDCQCAIFFIGRSEYTMNIGKMSHLLMDHGLEMNIGMCPIGTRSSFPKQINDALNTILIHEKLNGSNILHTLLIGKISNKQKREHTISKVKSMPSWSETLRIYLTKKLPMYMIPSHFISVSSFPSSPNGKIDRKALPEIALSVLQQEDTYNAPNTELEKMIANIWQEVLYTNRLTIHHDDPTKIVSGIDRQPSFIISTTTSFFTIGGNSLLLIETYQRYQSKFNFEREALSIRSLFDYSTIVEHARLLEAIIIDGAQLKPWHTLNINEGIASYAQERIFLDVQVRFSNQNAIYNELLIQRIKKGFLSVNRLLQALRYVLSKHKILRTSLVFNDDDSILKQSITDKHLTFTLAADQTFKSENELHNIIHQMTISPTLFDLSTGRVFYCQILRQQMTPDKNYDKEIITNSDVLVIGFHHIAIDYLTFPIFFNDLWNAYNSHVPWLDNEKSLQYIDYAVHERLIDMTVSYEFWRLQLEGYNLKRQLSLPIDQHCVSNNRRSGSASIAQITFDRKISSSFLNYASLHHFTLFQLGLATFYTFLFKLTYGQTDLCISCLNANRYRSELQTMIGMFTSTLPYCIKLDSFWSFDGITKHVREKCLSILEHSHYPLQLILRDFHLNQSNVPFLQTVFDFITESSVSDQFTFDDVNLQPVSLKEVPDLPKFDFTLTFYYDPILGDDILSCDFICSRDLFEDTTVTKMKERFQFLFEQLFSTFFNVNQTDLAAVAIAKLTLILPDEMNEMQRVAFNRQSNVTNEAPASFAQARIWLDERMRFDSDRPQTAIYNMPFVYRLQPGHTLSIKQLHHALHLTVNKHSSLHTSLIFDTEMNLLMQRVITHEVKNNNNNMFPIIETTYETDEELNEILHDEKRNPHLFDLAKGLVFRCHILYYKQISSNYLLFDKDVIIFSFHHSAFDYPSMNTFLHDLNQAYTTSQLLYDDNTLLRYLDYAAIEQEMSMTGASMFWLDALHDCKLDQPLSLPFDRYRLANEHRTGRGTSVCFDFGQDLSHDLLIHASSNNISLEHLTFATYFVFLFKLTNGQTDLCIAMNINSNRHRGELESIIGLFENVIPLRCQLDPYCSFHQLLEHVREVTTNSRKYSYFPLQRVLNQHPHISKHAFLDTSLEFISYKSNNDNNAIMIGDSQLVPRSFSINANEDETLSVCDFSLSIYHDLNMSQLSCTINASLDLFNIETAEMISQRFHSILHQLSASVIDNEINKPIYELSLTLSNEQHLMQSLNNTQVSFSSPLTCIHHEFVYQVTKHPQKLAVELDEQSLTYAELLYYVQVLSLTLVNEYLVTPGEVVCQCVERSLSMVIGIMGIEMAGGVYCPLSPRDPQHRLHALVQQTQSRLVLVHDSTKTKFDHDIASFDIDSILHVTNMDNDMNYNCLSSVKGEEIAYIIFTSGSTGTPKAVQVRHKNFIDCIHSLVYIDSFNKADTLVQMTRCSFDIHVQEILGTLLVGGALIMLHPGGTTDFDYLSEVQEAELFIGGVGVFARYHGRDDLSTKALVEIDGELFYRTGDLVDMSHNGLLYYQGRKDYQIKLHGQRIELGEIEQCLLRTSISACVVIKGSDDHLVAYVQSSDIDEKQLRQHCQSHLPPHMIPSFFIILDKLSLNANGKIDRKSLLIPKTSLHSPDTVDCEHVEPSNALEIYIHSLWYIQLAYLVGREGVIELGHVSSFGYSEYDFSSTFDIECFEQALNYLIQRHEALRLIFPSHTEQKILKIVPHYTISILNLDDIQSSQNHLIERREQLSHQIRPADQWPLFDFQITRFIRDDGYKIRLHFGIDILILDFWSHNLVLHELNQLYCNLNDTLVELKLSYRDYILAQQGWKHTTIYSNDRQYWINRLKSFPLGPNLPLQCLPNEIHVQRHSNAETLLDQTLWQKLRKRITDYGLTPAGFLASIYALVLSKWSENKHFALNLPVFNRLPIHPQVNQIAGDFTTIIPLEINLDKVITYYEFLRTVQKQLWNDLEHISYDGVSFMRDLMQMHQTREILLPYVFTCGIDLEDIREKNVEHNIFSDQKPVYAISQTPQVFIDHIVMEINGCLSINWTYVDNLFRKEMLNHMHDTFVDLLVKLASFDDLWQKFIFVPLPSEQQERRFDFNQTQWESNLKDKLLHSLVIKQAELTPNALAILSSQINLTYSQLMNRVYSLAYHLQQQQQQQTYSNQLIAILMTKGWEQVVACLAILVSGGAYLPLDVDSPYDRLCSLIEETNITILLTQSHCKRAFPHLTTVLVDTCATDDNYPTPFPIKQQSSTDLAYVIYTSGSTGKPKGVMISHQAVLNTILDMNSRLDISTNDRIFALSHLNFDLSVYDVFGMLIGGGTIVIANHEDYKNPQHWCDMIIQHQVTIWNSVPMLMQMFVEHLKYRNNHNNQLRHILLSGDRIPLFLPESIRATLGEQVTITSLGGATEASIWSIAYTLPKEIPREWKSIPYGIPLRNQQYYVYDIHLDDCPEWVIGELYIGGEGLANGYWNDQEKTQSSFIIHPLTNKRLYRTGDYGRFLPDGYIEFTGRKDFQVKVHGHRIELGEIEHHLQQHPDIQQAILKMDDKSQHLVGYVMRENHTIYNEEYDTTEILIVDPIERINFKLARHSIRYEKKAEKSFALTKPKLTETLINAYYMRKSYRQFTNETIERSTIEKLLRKCHRKEYACETSRSNLDFNSFCQLLSVLIPINVTDQPLPKYRYASAGSLYPVELYIEFYTPMNNIPSGLYYHNSDKQTLDLIAESVSCENIGVRLHLVGRSSAIAPLYGKRLSYQFCVLETGYILGLLLEEASKLGLILSNVTHSNMTDRQKLNLDEDDTHHGFTIATVDEHLSGDNDSNGPQCLVYLKSVEQYRNQWFIYDHVNFILSPVDIETKTTQEEIPLLFDDDNDAKIIFHDCQCAIFFIGRSEGTINIGKLSHLLMDHGLEMNIGMCPIGTRENLPKQINDALDAILIHEKLNGSNILHTLLIGKISNKQKSEHTISTVKSMPNWSETLRVYLKKKLPMYMVPSHFIDVSSFPLNSNGKIDRKALPNISLSVLQQGNTYNAPNTELEKTIANIWQEILYTNRLIIQHDDLESNMLPSIANLSGIDRQTSFMISITASFFSVGGNSLLLIKIYQHYQLKFNFETETLSVRSFFDYNTIVEHAKLLETIIIDAAQLKQWHTLHTNEGIASYAQERIFLDEQVRFSNQIAIYNELLIQRVKKGFLSVNRLLQALRYVLSKHKILRTSLVFNDEAGILKQSITDKHLTFTLAPDQTFRSETELHNIIHQMTVNPILFDLSTGHVFHAEILKHQISLNENENNSNEFITNSDVLLIAFHHAAFDRASFPIFFNDLCLAYNTNAISIEDDESLQYIDYSIHERLLDMSTSREFWYLQLEEYNLESRLLLPVDRHRFSNDHRSSSACITQISFGNEISQSFLDYASIHHVTPFQLGLTMLYTFLFKLAHGENDLCISCLNANRHKTELQNIMGMFVSTLPYRIQLDPHWSFDDLVEYVREKCLSILEHSHYPLQHILASLHIKQSSISFLETMYDFITISSHSDELSLNGASLKQVSFEQSFEVAKFDFMLMFVYNPILENNRLSFRLTCSHDLFDEITVTNIARRLEYCFQQLFSSNKNMNVIDTCFTSVSKFDLILPEETQEKEDIMFCRQSDIMNEAPASFAQIRLWHNESIHFTPHISQVPIYNMPFVYSLYSHHTLLVQHLRHALQLIVIKHQSLHTSLIFDTEKKLVMQRIIDVNDNSRQLFTFIESTYETDEQLNSIFSDEKLNPNLFDLAQGLVFRCHIIYYKQMSLNHLLCDKDVLVFNFHHALFDFPSMNIFLHDLNQAYIAGQLSNNNDTTLHYLDYTVLEQQISMTGASMFWLDVLHDCKLDQPLPLPYDRYRFANEHRTGCGTSISFAFDQDLSNDFLTHASSNNISLEQLTLSIYFIFLFKLTSGQTDLCISMNINNNRYRDELKSIIGLFENVIPLRCQLDPHWSFHQLLKHVQEMTTNSMKYSYFPLQRILNQHPHISKHAFLDTSLEFISYKSDNDNNTIMIGDSQIIRSPFSFNTNEDEILSASDFSLSVYHDINMNQLSCTINASLDLFNRETVEKISQRFHFILNQLSTPIIDNQINKPIYELSLTLSNERYLMQSMNNTQISFSSPLTCIHHEFVYQVMQHPQKLAVELDEQALTYCELLYYVQVLSLTLLNEYHVVPGEIVIGMMAIEMVGSVYCPLSPRDPQYRLHALAQQTQSRLVLVHHSTVLKFSSEIVLCNVDLIWTVDYINNTIIMDRLSDIVVTIDNTAYIVFTSGSTGISKGVQIRHRNLLASTDSVVRLNLFTNKDTMIQMASCSYDVHAREIIGGLITGSAIIMLRPQGNMALDYMMNTLNGKQVSYLQCVPTYANVFLEFLRSHSVPNLSSLRTFDIGGETSTVQLIDKLYTYLPQVCSVWNIYGPAETTVDCTCYVIGRNLNMTNIPIGRPLPNYRCTVMSEYLQSSVSSQEGELLIGGVGVFPGYLERDDLTAKALLEIDGQLFYRTGDLVTIDNNGLLHYQGRKDHQIK